MIQHNILCAGEPAILHRPSWLPKQKRRQVIDIADRHTLHINHVPEFENWLKSDGWEILEPKSFFEIIRARKGRRIMSVYRRSHAIHLTVSGRFVGVVWAFLKSKKGNLEKEKTAEAE